MRNHHAHKKEWNFLSPNHNSKTLSSIFLETSYSHVPTSKRPSGDQKSSPPHFSNKVHLNTYSKHNFTDGKSNCWYKSTSWTWLNELHRSNKWNNVITFYTTIFYQTFLLYFFSNQIWWTETKSYSTYGAFVSMFRFSFFFPQLSSLVDGFSPEL